MALINSMDLSEPSKKELRVAYELGFPLDKLTQKHITGAEYSELVDKLISYAAPEKLTEWQQHHTVFRNYKKNLNRYEAMASLYLAADTIGGSYDDFMLHNIDFLQTLNHDWDRASFNADLFDMKDMQRDNFYGGDFGNNNYLDSACYYFCTSRISNISGEFLFSYDAKDNSFKHLVDPTYAEALLAVIRLISSAEPELWEYVPGTADEPYLAMADSRREEIKNTVTDCTKNVTGTIYYISNSGNDNNDGRSPQTAWATVNPLLTGVLQSGDAILFERGGEWYLTAKEGFSQKSGVINFDDYPGYPTNITVGAYGEGEKPLLRGDIPEASDPSFWTLYSDKNGVKIWKSTVDLIDAPVIVFNEGETWADGIMPWISADKTYFMHPDGEKFTLENGLTKDLTFVWLPELTKENARILTNGDWDDPMVKAPVYLRCDAGNPVKIYTTVSLPQTVNAIALNNYCSAYDLDIRYFSGNGLSVTTRELKSMGQTFINLEVGWCGGNKGTYGMNEYASGIYGYSPFIGGGGIHIQSNADITITGCHVYHCGPMATILSMHGYEGISDGDDVWENYRIADNLFEYCGAPSHIADFIIGDTPNARGFLTNYVFENNLVMNSGYGWVGRATTQIPGNVGSANGGWIAAVENEYSAANNDGIFFRNNVFYRSRYAILAIRQTLMDGGPVNQNPIFEGNTYIQLSTLPLLSRNSCTELYFPSEQTMKEEVRDKTGTLVILEP